MSRASDQILKLLMYRVYISSKYVRSDNHLSRDIDEVADCHHTVYGSGMYCIQPQQIEVV